MKAILASEDKNFFKHEGIDKAAILRAFAKHLLLESRSGARRPRARHAPLNSSTSAINPRILGVIFRVVRLRVAPILASVFIQFTLA